MIIAGAAGQQPIASLRATTHELLAEQRQYCANAVAIVDAPGASLGAGSASDTELNLAQIGDCLIVADARLDNRHELEGRAGVRAGCCDAELLLALWLREGESSLGRIAGDFAVAIFDRRSGHLSLARDVTGQRPLFYTHTPSGIAFASMPAGLRPAMASFAVDRRSLAALAMDMSVAGKSFFADVISVAPAEVIRWSSTGGTRRNIYWTLPPKPPDHGDTNLLTEQYRHVLDEAVRPRLGPAPAAVASHLSGGFDSSSVAATAARLLADPHALIGFTSAPALATPAEKPFGFFAEESELAATVAAMHGFRHVVIRSTATIPEVIRSQTTLLQQPVRDPFNGAWWVEIRARAAALGATRLLTGELGNLTLNAGNLSTLSEWIRRHRWRIWFNQARAAAGRRDTKWRGVLFNSWRPWIPQSVARGLERMFLNQPSSRDTCFVRQEWQRFEKDQRAADIYAQRLAIIREADSGNLRKAALAQHGIEEADPFTDRRLIEFALSIPPDQLYWNGVQRPLMRKALADRLPQCLFDTWGRGLQSADWAVRLGQNEAFGLLEEISASHAAQDFLDIDRMRGAIERWPTRDWNEPSIVQEFRHSLLDAIGVGMFAAAYG